MRHFPLLPACALLLFLAPLTRTGGAVRADELSLAGGPPAPRPTLAQALAALEPPKQDLFLTVGADKVLLPPGEPPPDPTDRPGTVGAAYGRLARDFGGVMALAPPTMMVLNTHLGVPDPYAGLPAEDALKLLLVGLSPPQWAALTGAAGLGVSDLDDSQRGLFQSVLPSGGMTASREYSYLLPTHSWKPILLAERDMDAVRLRLGRRMQIDVPMVGSGNTGGTSLTPLVSGVAVYNADSESIVSPSMVYGAVLRRILPNSPKDADLDYNSPALEQSVRLEGVATVGGLVARVGKAAGLELYADRRYETRRITLVGRRTARGVDLLRSVAFCVAGTYRKVGPAYVLTDDIQGSASRRQRLIRFLQEAEIKLHAALSGASDSLAAAHGDGDALPWLGGLGFSSAQKALPQFNPSMGGSLTVPFALLTPAQQEFVGGYGSLDKSRPFTLHAGTRLLLLSPAAPGPVFLSYLSLDQIFQPSPKSQMELERRQAVGSIRKLPQPTGPLPTLVSLLASIPRRAVLIAPRTAAEVDQGIMEMQTLGFNQLWLDVFSGGHSRLDIPKGGGPDILTEALARTKGTGIAVIPALDLLRWGADAPAEARDLTVLGETSAEQQAWQQHYTDVTLDLPDHRAVRPLPADVWACPASPAVEATLLALVRRLAATPGVTTLALRDTVPPTYNHPPDAGISNFGDNSNQDLGFVPALRLMLLRRDHVDPLDMGVGFDTRLFLPEFDDWNALGNPAKEWNILRDAVSRDLLRQLLAAGQEAGGRRFRFLVRQRGDAGMGDWYGLWDDTHAPLPESSTFSPKIGPWHLPSEMDRALASHSQCRITLNTIGLGVFVWPPLTVEMLPTLTPGWDGILVDMTGPSVSDALAKLVKKWKR